MRRETLLLAELGTCCHSATELFIAGGNTKVMHPETVRRACSCPVIFRTLFGCRGPRGSLCSGPLFFRPDQGHHLFAKRQGCTERCAPKATCSGRRRLATCNRALSSLCQAAHISSRSKAVCTDATTSSILTCRVRVFKPFKIGASMRPAGGYGLSRYPKHSSFD
ncbi:hypothetical protein CSUI_003574 [Cystoisospora suis]|uniref:Uncharacterized protein n=1 Tax=Cystoisospora suis TaxID=483139 RepID=A0A2C6KPZ4_9APIC|nr:hypothetical protein CSUI_003574 [Cystoisospora suis]